MYGAIIGDIIASAYKSKGIKTKLFLLFSKASAVIVDSVMMVTVARAVMMWNKERESLQEIMVWSMRRFGWKYHQSVGGYTSAFQKWLGRL